MSRTTQPYRKGTNRPMGPALASMMRGRPKYLQNPSTLRSLMLRKRRRAKR